MKEGKYKNPKNEIDISPKIANIIVTYVPEGQVEYVPVRSTINQEHHEYYNENKLETIKFTLACHSYYKAGVDYEIIIIDNNSKNKEYFEYLKSLQFQIYHRENIGFSFGAFRWAWEKFGDKYDYYLFNEQDAVPAKDSWLLEILQRFLSDKEIGIVGNNIETRTVSQSYCKDLLDIVPSLRDNMYNLDGFMNFTSSKVLKQVDKVGGLKVLPVEGDTNAEYNELLFQQPILEL